MMLKLQNQESKRLKRPKLPKYKNKNHQREEGRGEEERREEGRGGEEERREERREAP